MSVTARLKAGQVNPALALLGCYPSRNSPDLQQETWTLYALFRRVIVFHTHALRLDNKSSMKARKG